MWVGMNATDTCNFLSTHFQHFKCYKRQPRRLSPFCIHSLSPAINGAFVAITSEMGLRHGMASSLCVAKVPEKGKMATFLLHLQHHQPPSSLGEGVIVPKSPANPEACETQGHTYFGQVVSSLLPCHLFTSSHSGCTNRARYVLTG